MAVCCLCLCTAAFSQNNPKREFRGAWIHIVGNQTIKTKTTEEIQQWFTETLDVLEEAGCNAVVFQVRPQADAFYESELEPWTRFLTGEQGRAPEPYWDPLAWMIEQCHSRGMELHAWLNPYRVTSNETEELCEGHLFWKNPEIFKHYGKQWYFDPAEPASREHTVKVIKDIVTRYDVDAIHFDDYFYPYPIAGEEFPDDNSFAKYAAAQGFGPDQRADWRRYNVALLIHEINDAIKEVKPWVRFGISPFGIHRNAKDTPDGSGSATNGLSNYEALYADVPQWAKDGDIDYIAPQLYWKIGHKLADYEVLVNWWNDQDLPGQLYVGQSIATLNEPDLVDPTTTQLRRKMELVRDLPDVEGNIWWPGWSIASNVNNIADSLSTTYQNNLALIPPYTHLDDVAPAPVAKFKARRWRKYLTWEASATDDVMQQPHFYVIYRFAPGAKVDISDPSAVYKITRDTTIYPEKSKPKYTYVVTVVDKCWNESAPSKALKY